MDSEQLKKHILRKRGLYDHEACESCSGFGVKAYSNTATWHGGMGGSSVTYDVCDRCWGSGNQYRPWLNLKRLKGFINNVSKVLNGDNKNTRILKENYIRHYFGDETNYVVVMIGIPGSGKSTFASKLFKEYEKVYGRSKSNTYLSSDNLRAHFGHSEEDQSVSKRVFDDMEQTLKEAIDSEEKRTFTIIDATNLTFKRRKRWYDVGEGKRVIYYTVLMQCDKDKALINNKIRQIQGGRYVPEDVISSMYDRIELPVDDEERKCIKHNFTIK